MNPPLHTSNASLTGDETEVYPHDWEAFGRHRNTGNRGTKMRSNLEVLQFIHRANIVKYQKILATYLTDLERGFVEHRLEEEKATLRLLAASATSAINLTDAA